MFRRFRWALVAALLSSSFFGSPRAEEPQPTDWGTITHSRAAGTLTLVVEKRPDSGLLTLPQPHPNVVAAHELDPLGRGTPLPLSLSAGAIHIELPPNGKPRNGSDAVDARTVVIDIADESEQRPEGLIVFVPGEARIEPSTAEVESVTGNEIIRNWTDKECVISWEYAASRPGVYELQLTYALEAKEASNVVLTIGGTELQTKAAPTGSFSRFVTHSAGNVFLYGAHSFLLSVRGAAKSGDEYLRLKAAVLRPTSEGRPVRQAADGTITCHGRDSTVHGKKLQYERAPKKKTLGYWVNANEWAHWDFEISKPGEFDVEILQGCGKGEGGSDVELLVAEQKLSFVVEDTGHFQNFKPRSIGVINLKRVGSYRLEVRPRRKAKTAVMDLRQVRLVPRR